MDRTLSDLYVLAATSGVRLIECRTYNASITFGRGVSLDHVAVEGNVTLGDFSYANRNCEIKHAVIGNYCSIASGVRIAPNRHATEWLSTHPMMLRHSRDPYLAAPQALVSIGHDVWLGGGCVVMAEVSIGDGAIVAAGAVVTKDVPPFAIVGGTPAEVIRYRFPEKDRDLITQSAWWDWDFSTSKASLDLSEIGHALKGIELAQRERTLKRLPQRRLSITIEHRATISTAPPSIVLD